MRCRASRAERGLFDDTPRERVAVVGGGRASRLVDDVALDGGDAPGLRGALEGAARSSRS